MASNMNMTSDDRLKAAAQQGNIDLLYTVIQENPNVLDNLDLIPFVETPLHIAASFGHLRFSTEIMRLKPSFGWKLNQQGLSPIHLAMEQGKKRMVLRFININKDLVRVKGKEGLTPLHFATQIGEIDLLVNFLLACPDSIEDVNVRSETAMHIAVKYQQYEALQVLVGWLKRTRQTRAAQLEEIILNWKDEDGNTILHVSALMNDSQALGLLVKAKTDLKAKNSENSTALDIATNAEVKNILLKAGAKHGSSLTNVPSFADKLKSKITFMEKIIISILRIRRDITEDQRNAFLIVATLVATTTFQSALSPPGGVYQANAGDNNNVNTTSSSLNSTTPDSTQGHAVMPLSDFFTLWNFNTLAFLVSTISIFILTPSGIMGNILFAPTFCFAYCYLYSMKVISPANAVSLVNYFLMLLLPQIYGFVSWKFAIVNKKLDGDANREIKIWKSGTVNRW